MSKKRVDWRRWITRAFSALETAYVGSTVDALSFFMPHVCDTVGVNGTSKGSDGMEVSCGGGGDKGLG